jgi:hypothetical protein
LINYLTISIVTQNQRIKLMKRMLQNTWITLVIEIQFLIKLMLQERMSEVNISIGKKSWIEENKEMNTSNISKW